MPTTITAYNTFIAASKAKADEVNTNFSNHRGTLLPINESTFTASDLTHDLGSSEHRWATVYSQGLYIYGQTTTDHLTTEYTSSSHNILFGAATACSFGINGLTNKFTTTTDNTDPGLGGLAAITNTGSVQITGTAVNICTLRLTVENKPVKLFFFPANALSTGNVLVSPGTSIMDLKSEVLVGDTTTSLTTLGAYNFRPTNVATGTSYDVPIVNMEYTLLNPGSGARVFQYNWYTGNTGSANYMRLNSSIGIGIKEM